MSKKHKKSPPSTVPRLRVLMGSMTAMGPGRADLMDAIENTGSISAAARELGMSYRRAWVLIESTNAAFVEPLVVTSAGGSGGGGAQVTDFGRGIVAHYRAMERKAAEAVAADFAVFSKLMNPLPAASLATEAEEKKPARKTAAKRTS